MSHLPTILVLLPTLTQTELRLLVDAASARLVPQDEPTPPPKPDANRQGRIIAILMASFSTDELYRLIQYDSRLASMLPGLPPKSRPTIECFSAAVDQATRYGHLETLTELYARERPRRLTDFVELQALTSLSQTRGLRGNGLSGPYSPKRGQR